MAMPRALRIEYPGAIYHVLNRAVCLPRNYFIPATKLPLGVSTT
jgi:hypothetical protein